MGQVWCAVHRDLGYPVAVKFLTARTYRKTGFLEAFRNEIRSVAALDHPNIVSVLDHGEASMRTEKATRGRIRHGTPWLAMELVGGGTLAPLCGRLTWPEVESVIEALLGALGHAHGRGVIHRDLKPGNVLVGTATGHHLWVKLTDFGLAQAVEVLDLKTDRPFTGGTPAYMAPEQFEGRWRDFGPWTDLYGAGCLIWALVRGATPYGKRPPAELKECHLHEPLPPMVAPWQVPLGFEDWLARMLHKEPAERFRRAADALHAFGQLGPFLDGRPTAPANDPTAMATLVLGAMDTVPDGPPGEHTTLPLRLYEPADTRLTLATSGDDVPPAPADWRPEGLQLEAVTPTGLGLFGLRPPPLVDRETERDTLWAILRRASRGEQVHAVVLSGADGSGKSRLADWLCQRAHEVGAAHVLRAHQAPVAGPTHGLGPMLARFLRCQGMRRSAILQRVEAIFRAAGVAHADEWEALTEVISPAPADETGTIRFGSPTERYVTVRRVLQALARERPIVVWLDDAHVALDALSFTRYLLTYAARTGLPVMLVLTVTDEELDDRIDEASVLSEIVAHDRAIRIPVGPLPPTHRAALVRGVLGLEAGLARRVEARTGGNPLFVVQLVDDWVQRSVLEAGPEGFRLKIEHQNLLLPADVQAMWSDRVDRLLVFRSEPERRALEAAATLGTEVDAAEWSAVCARARWQTHGSEVLVNALLDQRLARCGPEGPSEGWTFAHGSLRESLLSRSQRAGRLEGWHRVIAEVLEERDREVGGTGLTERIGRHWLGAGSPGAAIPRLLVGARERANTGDYATAEVLLALREEALAGLPASPADPRWADGWVTRLAIAGLRGGIDDVERWLVQVERSAERHGWSAAAGRARCHRGRRARVRGDFETALELLLAAERDADARDDTELLAETRREIGTALLDSGDVEGAETWLRLALQHYDGMGDTAGRADCWKRLGDLDKERGQHRAAETLLRTAEGLYAECGNRWGMAGVLNTRGDIARARGDLDQADALYRRARGLLKAIGSASWVYPEYNLGLLHLERGDHGRARRVLHTTMHAFEAHGDSRAVAQAHLCLGVCAAADRNWPDWDRHMAAARHLLSVTGAADEDTARLASTAGARAHDAHQLARARDAYELASALWRALSRGAEQSRVDHILAALR